MIMDTARMLGIELSESDEFKNMLNAQKSLTEDTAASAMLNEYKLKQKIIMDLLPNENLDREQISLLSADIERIQSILMVNASFTRAVEAQAAFQELIREVNKVISSCIGIEMGAEPNACSGACDSCAGCKH